MGTDDMPDHVWVGYAKKPPYLPQAVADTAAELARMMGTTQNAVYSTWFHYLAGRVSGSRYHRVRVGCEAEKREGGRKTHGQKTLPLMK